MDSRLLVFISTCPANTARRRAVRRSWFQFKRSSDSPLTPDQRARIELVFIAAHASCDAEFASEVAAEGDIVLLDAPEGYDQLWRKALVFLQQLVCERGQPDPPPCHPRPHFVMHADDDSYLRLDLLLPLVEAWPRTRHYWGYIWDGTGARVTAPIRDPSNKSHMPESQYKPDYYPPFASGCGFALSWDLVTALATAELPDYRLLDPPFGIHLCGAPEMCVLPEGPVVPVHEPCVRPYRPLPTFRPNTLVQHYLRPEEFVPFHQQALQAILKPTEAAQQKLGPSAELYNSLVGMGLLRR